MKPLGFPGQLLLNVVRGEDGPYFEAMKVFSTSSYLPLCHEANKSAKTIQKNFDLRITNNSKKFLLIFAHFGRTSGKVAQGTAMNAA